MKNRLVADLSHVEEEMIKHFANQKVENSKLQSQLSKLKTYKTVLQNQLIGNLFVK